MPICPWAELVVSHLTLTISHASCLLWICTLLYLNLPVFLSCIYCAISQWRKVMLWPSSWNSLLSPPCLIHRWLLAAGGCLFIYLFIFMSWAMCWYNKVCGRHISHQSVNIQSSHLWTTKGLGVVSSKFSPYVSIQISFWSLEYHILL